MKSNKTCEFHGQCGKVWNLTCGYAVWGKLLSRSLRKSPWLENYPVWVDATTMGEQLLLLLNNLQVECPQAVQGLPYLVLTRCEDGSYRWLCFRKFCRTQSHLWPIDQIERAVVHIYLAHASQMSQDEIHDINGNLFPLESRYILCPERLLNYIEGPKIAGKELKDAIEEAMLPINLVRPADGDYRYRREVLKWQTSLAVWRKHGEKHIEGYLDLPPPYSEKKISSDYANHQSN